MLPDYTKQKYDELGGIYFPILQQDNKTRVNICMPATKHNLMLVGYLRQHDRVTESEGA